MDKQASEASEESEALAPEQDIVDDPVLMGAITLLLVLVYLLNRMSESTC